MKVIILRCVVIVLLFSSVNAYHKRDTLARGWFLNLLFMNPCGCRCGVANREARFSGGEYQRGHEFPWFATLQIDQNQTIPATLINNKYAITLASLLLGVSAYNIKVILGQYDRCYSEVSTLTFGVVSILLHPSFNQESKANNIALVKLTFSVNFEKNISPACLASLSDKYDSVSIITGWGGQLNVEKKINCRPRKIALPLLEYNECIPTVIDAQYLTIDKKCVGVVGTPSPICDIDAGNAVLYKTFGGSYEIIGVLGDENNCTGSPNTALYTRIEEHLDWLIENTRDACYCIKF